MLNDNESFEMHDFDDHEILRAVQHGSVVHVFGPDGRTEEVNQTLTMPGKVSERLLRSLELLLDHGVPAYEFELCELGLMCHDAAEAILLYSARKGHLRIVKYFLAHYVTEPNQDGNQWYPGDEQDASHGDEPVPWRERDLTGLAKRAFAAAAAGGQLEVLQFMHKHFLTQEKRFQALKEKPDRMVAYRRNNIFAVKKKHAADIPWDSSATANALAFAVANKQLKALAFLRSNNCPWSHVTRDRATDELGFTDPIIVID